VTASATSLGSSIRTAALVANARGHGRAVCFAKVRETTRCQRSRMSRAIEAWIIDYTSYPSGLPLGRRAHQYSVSEAAGQICPGSAVTHFDPPSIMPSFLSPIAVLPQKCDADAARREKVRISQSESSCRPPQIAPRQIRQPVRRVSPRGVRVVDASYVFELRAAAGVSALAHDGLPSYRR